MEDLEKVRAIPGVARAVPLREFPTEDRHQERKANGQAVGTVPELADVERLATAAGRFLTPRDADEKRNVAVLGPAVAKELFPLADPVGKTVQLGNHLYEVVGVLRAAGPGGGADEWSQAVFIPLTTMNARFGDTVFVRQAGARTADRVALTQIVVDAGKPADRDTVRQTIAAILQSSHTERDWELK